MLTVSTADRKDSTAISVQNRVEGDGTRPSSGDANIVCPTRRSERNILRQGATLVVAGQTIATGQTVNDQFNIESRRRRREVRRRRPVNDDPQRAAEDFDHERVVPSRTVRDQINIDVLNRPADRCTTQQRQRVQATSAVQIAIQLDSGVEVEDVVAVPTSQILDRREAGNRSRASDVTAVILSQVERGIASKADHQVVSGTAVQGTSQRASVAKLYPVVAVSCINVFDGVETSGHTTDENRSGIRSGDGDGVSRVAAKQHVAAAAA